VLDFSSLINKVPMSNKLFSRDEKVRSIIMTVFSVPSIVLELRIIRVLQDSNWKILRSLVNDTTLLRKYKERRKTWVQAAGHEGSFVEGNKKGTVLKKYSLQEEECYKELMQDNLMRAVPRFFQTVEIEGEKYMELCCCLSDFKNPSIMDIKMGVRTFVESEVSLNKQRSDLYERMISEDPESTTEEENRKKSVTKLRYLDWRDERSSSRSLGFRVEGLIKDGKTNKDFKSLKSQMEISCLLKSFISNGKIKKKYLERLKEIESLCIQSNFFQRHQLIGTSLLFVNDDKNGNIWMIDFGKSYKAIAENEKMDFSRRENGYLDGLRNIISILESIRS